MRILVADDQPLLLSGICHALEREGHFDVVGTTCNGAELLPLVRRLDPAVVLVGMHLPGLDGLGCLTRIRSVSPDVKVVMLAVQTDHAQVQAAFALGACGYVAKSIDPFDLPSALRQSVEGTVFHALGAPVLDQETTASDAGLTFRELSILKTVARGLPNLAVAAELHITEQTVKFHLTNIYKKLGVANRTEATRWARDKGLVEDVNLVAMHI